MNLFEKPGDASLLKEDGLVYGEYCLKLASTARELQEAQKLRFQVFNEELGEGVAENQASGLDVDAFDERCDQLLLYKGTLLVGTCRLLPGVRAKLGDFYTQTEFSIDKLNIDFSVSIEMGRVCIHEQYRRKVTLVLLFWALQNYLILRGARFLFGCSSLPKMSANDAEATYEHLCERGSVDYVEGVGPLPENSFKGDVSKGVVQVPQLLNLYLDFGARVLGRPAYDPVFGCFDFLTVLDVTQLKERGLNLVSRFNSGRFRSSNAGSEAS